MCMCTFVVRRCKSSSWNERHPFPITKISPSVTEPHRNCQHPLTYVYCSTTKPLSICELHIVKVSNDHNITIFNWLPPKYLPWRPAPPNASTVFPLNLPRNLLPRLTILENVHLRQCRRKSLVVCSCGSNDRQVCEPAEKLESDLSGSELQLPRGPLVPCPMCDAHVLWVQIPHTCSG